MSDDVFEGFHFSFESMMLGFLVGFIVGGVVLGGVTIIN